MTKKKSKKEVKAKSTSGTKTKEQVLVELLRNGKFHTVKEIIKATGYAEASVNMYVSQSYLDRKKKPFKVIEKDRIVTGVKEYAYRAAKK